MVRKRQRARMRLPRGAFGSSQIRNRPPGPNVSWLKGGLFPRPLWRFVMKKLLLAAGVIGAMTLTASPATAQRYHGGHTSFSVTIGSGYGYAPYGYGYGYSPYSYGYAYPVAYDPYYYPPGRYYAYYHRDNWRRHHRHDRRYYRHYRY